MSVRRLANPRLMKTTQVGARNIQILRKRAPGDLPSLFPTSLQRQCQVLYSSVIPIGMSTNHHGDHIYRRSPKHPAANGLVELLHRMLMCAIMYNEDEQQTKVLPYFSS